MAFFDASPTGLTRPLPTLSCPRNGSCRTSRQPAAIRRHARPALPARARHSRNFVRIWPYQCRGKRGVRKQATVTVCCSRMRTGSSCRTRYRPEPSAPCTRRDRQYHQSRVRSILCRLQSCKPRAGLRGAEMVFRACDHSFAAVMAAGRRSGLAGRGENAAARAEGLLPGACARHHGLLE